MSSSCALWRRSSLATTACVLLAGLGLDALQAFAERPLIAELKWIDSDADAVAVLTTAPTECLVMPKDPDRARLARLGRVAFRSPVLLGGLAARVRLSCDSCHQNGHSNPTFRFTGVSGEPGTADVTGSVFSTNREDGRSNAVPIPTLVDAGLAPPFGSILPTSDLRTFIRAAVVDEFQGEPPLNSVVEGLVVYVTGLQSAGCPNRREEVVSFGSDANEILELFDIMIDILEQDDRHTGQFMLISLQAALERIYQRFPERVTDREELIGLSRTLSRLRMRLEKESLPDLISSLAAKRSRFEAISRKLELQSDVSFYEATVLRRALDSKR